MFYVCVMCVYPFFLPLVLLVECIQTNLINYYVYVSNDTFCRQKIESGRVEWKGSHVDVASPIQQEIIRFSQEVNLDELQVSNARCSQLPRCKEYPQLFQLVETTD